FVLCLGYKGQMIKQYFLNYDLMNSDFTMQIGSRVEYEMHGPPPGPGLEVTLADTGASTMTGGRIARARRYIEGDTFLATYGDGECILEREPLERLAEEGELMAYRHDGFFHAMDTHRDYEALNGIWQRGEAPWKVWGEGEGRHGLLLAG